MGETAASTHSPAYFGARLTSLLTQSALGHGARTYLEGLPSRRAKFVTCLVGSRDDQFTYDLRLVSRPDPARPGSTDVQCYVLTRIGGTRAAMAADYGQETLRLLHAQFPEYGFAAIPSDELAVALNPFEPASLVSITRRASLEALHTLKSPRRRRSIGFLSDSTPGVESEESAVDTPLFHVFPFLPRESDFPALLRYLVSMQAPACVSIRLKPTTLTGPEESFLESQIAACERHLRLRRIYPGDDESDLNSALRHQAELLAQFQQRQLFGLWDDAAVMTIEIASAGAMPRPLIDLVGSLITGPAGGARAVGNEPFNLYFAGGYDVYDLSSRPDHLEAFRTAQVCPTCPPEAPVEAGRLVHLFDATEAANAFRLPACPEEELPGLDLDYWRSLPAPRNLPNAGTSLGANVHRGLRTTTYLADADRRRHMYVIGQTGTGKTTLLRSLILEDMQAGHGLCVVDPHGDLFLDLVGRIPPHRREDVVLLDPTDADFPVGLNLLECDSELQRYFVAQEVVGIFSRLLADEYGDQVGSFTGPIFYQQIRMTLLLLMSKLDRPGTLLDFYTIFQSKDYWRNWTPTDSSDPTLRRWIEEVLPKTDYFKMSSDSNTSLGMYIGSKFENFIFDPRLRNIFGQPRSTLDLRKVIDERKILLVNLAKGPLTEANSRFLGMVFLAKLIATVMGRLDVSESKRHVFHLYVDEFQSVATDGFTTLLSEARKFGLNLVLANQFLSQVANQRIIDAVFGNVGTMIAFRIGHKDAELLEPQFAPELTSHDLLNLPNWSAYTRTLANGERVAPFNIATSVDGPRYDAETAAHVRAESRRRWAQRRQDVGNS